MRTIYSKSLIVTFLFLFIGVQTSFSTIRTYLQEQETCPDEVIAMSVYVENLYSVDSFNIVVNFDPEVLEYRGFDDRHPDLVLGDFSIDYLSGRISLVFSFPDSSTLETGNAILIFLRFNPIAGFTELKWNQPESSYFFNGQMLPADFFDGSVLVYPEPHISIVQIPEEVCPFSFDASIIATITDGTPPYDYTWIGSPLQELSDSIVRNLAADGSLYRLEIEDSRGCKNDTIFEVNKLKLNEIEITASPDTVFISNPTVTFSAENLSEPAIVNYFWRFGDGDSINTALPIAPHIYFGAKEFAKEGGQEYEVILTVTNELGCDTTLIYKILLREAPIFIPNVFTPNGDGANDEFKIVRDDDKNKIISDEYLRLELVVYNRWGKKIYSSDNYRSDWDGGNAPDGVYFYVLKAIGFYKIDNYKGAVHILR